jgi:Carboxypeptidase regulatory-like domain
MTSLLTSLLLLSLLGGGCLPRPMPATKPDQRSQVLTFRRTAIMDTVTAILDGRVVGLCNQQPVPAAVQLASATTTLQAVATPDGKFRFFHIPAGDYTLKVTCPTYTKLADAPVHLGTGDAAETTIGLECRAADHP